METAGIVAHIINEHKTRCRGMIDSIGIGAGSIPGCANSVTTT